MSDVVSQRAISASAVSWPAVFAGAAAATAFALVLLTLGTGLGLSAVSPWGGSVKGSTLGYLAIAWLLAVQLFAFGLGGYIAGRLRTRWLTVDRNESYFRDTAHGLLVWCVGTIVSACLAATILSSALSTTASTASSAVTNGAQYFVDVLLRSDQQSGDPDAARKEIGLIFGRMLDNSEVTDNDRSYAAQVIARQTGISQTDAEQRLSQTADRAKSALEATRKLALYASLWVFVALLIGAFSASYMATVGGEARDEVD
ncbi:MAG: hypothetical protein BGP04_00760 [Rhizobiales bacterium 62-17]|nr:hypothetical protein [Hyphomicrobiales bacterium]OJY03995.1 MAG: hypothetical protein BGP04_00760 [Rhizobiales bacterium 62-17]